MSTESTRQITPPPKITLPWIRLANEGQKVRGNALSVAKWHGDRAPARIVAVGRFVPAKVAKEIHRSRVKDDQEQFCRSYRRFFQNLTTFLQAKTIAGGLGQLIIDRGDIVIPLSRFNCPTEALFAGCSNIFKAYLGVIQPTGSECSDFDPNYNITFGTNTFSQDFCSLFSEYVESLGYSGYEIKNNQLHLLRKRSA